MSHRILFLSADFGSGHLAAAKAIAAGCRALQPGCETQPVQLQSHLLDLVTWGYLRLIDWVPALYRQLYQMEAGPSTKGLIHLVLEGAVREAIDQFQPTCVVGTHPFPAGVAARLRQKGQFDCPVVMALTDFVPHGHWIHPGVDRYCVASDHAATALRQAGVHPDRIAVTGIAIRPDFGDAATAQASAATGPGRRVLVMGGGLGLGPIADAVRSLAAVSHPDLAVTVVCGQNQELKRQLDDLVGDDRRITVVGYSDQIPRLMAESDLLVTKPGGITCAEALSLGLPMLLLQPLPGHEEENAAYLAQTGGAVVTDAAWVGQRAAELFFTRPHWLELMRQQALQAGRPGAALAIANEIFIKSSASHHLATTVC